MTNPHILATNMKKDLVKLAIVEAISAIETKLDYFAIANNLVSKFEERVGSSWHCYVYEWNALGCKMSQVNNIRYIRLCFGTELYIDLYENIFNPQITELS